MKKLISLLLIVSTSLTLAKEKKLVNSIQIKNNTFYYTLNVVNVNQQLEFHVDLKFKSDSIHKVSLPVDYYGTPDLHKWVQSFKVNNGTKIIEEVSNFRMVSPNEKGKIHIQYQIKYDPVELDKYSYAPNVSNTFFYVAGCQWMLPNFPLTEKATYHISMKSDNKDWTLYSSLSEKVENIVVESSFEDMLWSGFGGNSDQDSQVRFELEGIKYSVFINGDFSFNKKDFFKELKQTLLAQESIFNDNEKSYYHITILPRSGLLAGASIPNLFYCFVDKERPASQIQDLIGHEYFHKWLPNKMYLPTLTGEYSFKHEWFHEGFNEYFSRRVLHETGMMPRDQYVESMNEDVVFILNNPSKNETYEQIAARPNFGSAQKKLSYARGVLIALKWDTELVKKGSSLKEMLLSLYEISKKNEFIISYNDLYAFGNKYGLDFKNDFESFILQGKKIPLTPEAFSGYEIVQKKVQLFYPGFDVSKSSKEKRIHGVDHNGPAHKAGLRNGMTYVKRKNSNRWSNSWSKEKPYVVTVVDNGQEKAIAFFPYGELAEDYFYQKK